MSSFNFHFRPSTRPGKTKGSVFLRVIHERKSFCISLGLYVYPEEWDVSQQTSVLPLSSSPRYAALKTTRDAIDSVIMQMERIISELESQGYYTLNDIRLQLRRRRESGMLTDFVAGIAEEISLKQERTARAYKSTLASVLEFNRAQDIKLSRINRRFVEAYEAHLKEKGLHMNTISFYMRNLRAVYNRAVRAGFIAHTSENPFSRVFTGIKTTEKRALDASQIRSLVKLDPSLIDFSFARASKLDRGLRDALAIFMFAFLAQGMSFVDLAYLRKENISGGVIRYRRKKTGQYIEVSVCREMKSIIAYFSERTSGSVYVFPIIKSSGKPARLQYESALRLQNLRLRKLGLLTARIDRITTHAARHSWATIAKNEKIDISIISEALGHNNENTTRIYLDSFKKKLLDKANERIRSAIKKAV